MFIFSGFLIKSKKFSYLRHRFFSSLFSMIKFSRKGFYRLNFRLFLFYKKELYCKNRRFLNYLLKYLFPLFFEKNKGSSFWTFSSTKVIQNNKKSRQLPNNLLISDKKFRHFFEWYSSSYTLRCFEVNKLVRGFVFLPIPNFYFFLFIIDQKYLWYFLLIEMNSYFRSGQK